MFIDTHAHLNFKAYKDDLEVVIKRTIQKGVSVINVGTKYETSKRAVEIAEKYKNLYASIGLHPIHITSNLIKIRVDEDEGGFETNGEELKIEEYENLAKSKKVVAIGEIGLDYYYKPKTTGKKLLFKEKQREVFVKQLELAGKLNLPVILHCRMAHLDLIEILKIEKKRLNIKGVIHCFTGNLEELEEYLKLGLYIGFNGIIFKLNLNEVIKKTPIDKILIETDAPYLTPIQEGEKRNEPLFAKYVIEKIAEIKNISYEEIERITTENAKRLFKI